MKTAEVLISYPIADSALAMLSSVHHAARYHGLSVVQTQQYQGRSDLLFLYGVGERERSEACRRQVKSGRHVICFDASFWDRGNKMKVSIDGLHCPQYLYKFDPAYDRAEGIVLEDHYDPNGPILLTGIGWKSREMLGLRDIEWELQRSFDIQEAYPQKVILYRPKKKGRELVPGTRLCTAPDIFQSLSGTSLLVCRHSNTAVDACRYNIPAVCEDGMGAALYNNDLLNPVHPDERTRRDFLQRVGWFQWHPSEAVEMLGFIKDLL